MAKLIFVSIYCVGPSHSRSICPPRGIGHFPRACGAPAFAKPLESRSTKQPACLLNTSWSDDLKIMKPISLIDVRPDRSSWARRKFFFLWPRTWSNQLGYNWTTPPPAIYYQRVLPSHWSLLGRSLRFISSQVESFCSHMITLNSYLWLN